MDYNDTAKDPIERPDELKYFLPRMVELLPKVKIYTILLKFIFSVWEIVQKAVLAHKKWLCGINFAMSI